MKIALSGLLVFLFLGCSDDAQTQEKSVKEQKVTKTEEVKQEVVQEKEIAKPETKVEPKQVVTEVAKVETKAEPKKEVKTEAKKEVKQEIKTEVKKEVAAIKKEVAEAKTEVVAVKKDPVALYKSCVSCHGADASKSALNKSEIIKGWSAQKIADALQGYKDGTYGGAAKALMKGQVAKLDKEDIEILSKHIAAF